MRVVQTLRIDAKMVNDALLILDAEMKYLKSIFLQLTNSYASILTYQVWDNLYADILADYHTINTSNGRSPHSLQWQEIQELNNKIDKLYGDMTQELAEVFQEWENISLNIKNLSIIVSNLFEVKSSLRQFMQLEILPYYDHDPEKGSIVKRVDELYDAFSLLMEVSIQEEKNDFFALDFEAEIKLARDAVIVSSSSGSFSKEAFVNFKQVLATQEENCRLLKIITSTRPIANYLPMSQDLYDFISSVRRVSFDPKYILDILNGISLSKIENALVPPKRQAPSLHKVPTLFNQDSVELPHNSVINKLTLREI